MDYTEPLLHDGPFRFQGLHPPQSSQRLRARTSRHAADDPPAELLLYFRVLAGLKGMMTRTDASVNVRAIAEACQARRGIV